MKRSKDDTRSSDMNMDRVSDSQAIRGYDTGVYRGSSTGYDVGIFRDSERQPNGRAANDLPRRRNDPMVGGTSDNESRPWGHGEYANLPQEVRMQEYPRMPYRDLDTIDDTHGRLEDDALQEQVGQRRNLYRGMY